MRTALLASAVLLAAALARPADACSIAGPMPHIVDEAEAAVDTTPPGAVRVENVSIGRRDPTYVPSPCTDGSSCGGGSSIGFDVLPTDDDRTPPDQLGYLVEVASGEAPEGLFMLGEPQRPMELGDGRRRVSLFWSEPDGLYRDTVAFTLRVRAVDLAGNLGPELLVPISDGEPPGCAQAPLNRLLPIGLLALMLLRRRR